MARPKSADTPKKARKPRGPNKKKAKPEAEAASPPPSRASVEFKKPAKADVVSLVKKLENRAEGVKTITQEMGEMVAKGVENKHFDKKALGIARGLYRMAKNKPEAFSRTFSHLLAYCDDLELDKIAEQNQGMDLDEPEGRVTSHGASEPRGDDDFDDETGDSVPSPTPTAGLRVIPKSDSEAA